MKRSFRRKRRPSGSIRITQRLLGGRVGTSACRPMSIVEIDELEADFYLVAVDDFYLLVGPAKVYMIIDTQSHLIPGVSIAFEANSYLDISNAMMSLHADKAALCKEVDCIIADGIWPTGYLPDAIHCDGGSEMTSDNFNNMCRNLGMRRVREAPAMGAMKDMIEQSFRLFQHMISIDFGHKGYVRKCYDSDHREKACLNINDFKKLVYLFVAYHNSQWSNNFVTKTEPYIPEDSKCHSPSYNLLYG